MWTSSLSTMFKSSAGLKMQSTLLQNTQRNFCFRWMNKHRDIYYPSSWNVPKQRPNYNGRVGKIKYNTQDPLYLDEKRMHIHGGIKTYLTRLHDDKAYDIPLRNIAFILYHCGKERIPDRLAFKMFEANYKTLSSTDIGQREAYGGLYGCYATGYASIEGLKYWEDKFAETSNLNHVREYVELMRVFVNSEAYDKKHFIKFFKLCMRDNLLEKWDTQVIFNQFVMRDLIEYFKIFKYYDEEIYMKMVKSINTKKKILYIDMFDCFYNFIHDLNEDPK